MTTGEFDNKVPTSALVLGFAGLVPFAFLSVASYFYTGLIRSELIFALIAYGAVILSFLGGVHWGVAVAAPHHLSFQRLSISVVPSLVGWVALLLPEHHALWILGLAFGLMLVIDGLAKVQQVFPAWYLRLRWILTIVVCLFIFGALVGLR